MKTAGILAGLGPLAGAHFYRRVIELTAANDDQMHIPIVLISEPLIPSRLSFLEGVGPSPMIKLLDVSKRLISAGAEFIVIPSSTAHIFYSDLVDQIPIPILSIVKEVTEEISKTTCKSIGILGTTPTKTYGIYDSGLAQSGIQVIYPDCGSQIDITAIIDSVKCGDTCVKSNHSRSKKNVSEQLYEVACRSWCKNVDGLLLACTEIPVLFPIEKWITRQGNMPKLFNSTDILARAVINTSVGA